MSAPTNIKKNNNTEGITAFCLLDSVWITVVGWELRSGTWINLTFLLADVIFKLKGNCMHSKSKSKKPLENDAFFAKNFEDLVHKYGGKTIVISNGEVFTGSSAVEKAEQKFPNTIPMLLTVPRKELFLNGFLL